MNKNWFTRFPQDNIDIRYLDGITIATKFFMNWLKDKGFGRLSYREMLIGMHRRVCGTGYNGYTNPSDPIVLESEFRRPGVLKRPVLKREWYKDLVVVGGEYIQPEVLGFDRTRSHLLKIVDGGLELHLPDAKYIPLYLDRMESVMELLCGGISVTWLAQYIQLFVICHPFERVNFSICMAQVNALLHLNEYYPIHHNYLDFNCFGYDYMVIKNILAEMIRGANNGLSV